MRVTASGYVSFVLLAFASQQAMAQPFSTASAGTFLNANAAIFSSGSQGAVILPIDFAEISTVQDLDGKVIGGIISTLDKSVTGFDPGSYEIYADHYQGALHLFLMSGGSIAAELIGVEVSQDAKPADVEIAAAIGMTDDVKPRWYVCVYDHWVCFHDILK